MTVDDVALRVADALNAACIPYMLVGGFSSNYYGIPRSTKDADFVVQLDAFTSRFAAGLGPDFEPEEQLTFETNTGTQRQNFRVKGSIFKVEMFRLSNDPHDQERFGRRRRVEFQGHIVFFPSAEDVIVWKLRWARARDKDDVRAVIGVQQQKLDWRYIESWCERHGTRRLLEQIRSTVPKL